MKHLQPYYKQAIRQILSENRLSALFDVDQIYDALCTFPTPQTAADHICTLRKNENFTWKKLEKCQEIARKEGWRKFETPNPRNKYRILLQAAFLRASNLRIAAEAKVKLTRNLSWETYVSQLDLIDEKMLVLFSEHYKLPKLPPFFPCDLSTLSTRMVRKS